MIGEWSPCRGVVVCTDVRLGSTLAAVSQSECVASRTSGPSSTSVVSSWTAAASSRLWCQRAAQPHATAGFDDHRTRLLTVRKRHDELTARQCPTRRLPSVPLKADIEDVGFEVRSQVSDLEVIGARYLRSSPARTLSTRRYRPGLSRSRCVRVAYCVLWIAVDPRLLAICPGRIEWS